MSDLLFRGRGADIGGRAPAWLVWCAGAVYMLFGAVVATSARGAVLWLVCGLLTTTFLALHFVPNVHSTRDEALAFAALECTLGWRQVVLGTSPPHSRRACAAVEHTGLSVQCLPAAVREYALTRLDRPENWRLAFADVL